MGESKTFYYIKKLIPFILVVCILATVLVSLTLTLNRKFTASLVINYEFASAEQGLTPSDEELDVNEIKSSAIMSRVIDDLGLSGSYSVDNLTSRISITKVPDADKEAAKEAAIEDGEDYVYVPTKYIISFTATNSEGADFARKILDSSLDNYFQVFGEKYLNADHISNKLGKIYENNYDYIDMVEYIDKYVSDTINSLYERDAAYPFFRSTATGKSFDDLVDAFSYVHDTKISDLFARILKYQVTKSKSILNTTYNNRIDQNNITSTTQKLLVENIETIIGNYVAKMKESGNTDITYEYILDQINDKNTIDIDGNTVSVDQTVTYDDLIYAWRNFNSEDRLAIIDTAYCNYILSNFNECRGTCGDSCSSSTETCAALSTENYDAIEKTISQDINDVVDELSDLYDIAIETNDEYNEYLGCANISVLSTSSTKVNVDVVLYTVIAFVFFMIICCGGALLVGRMNDIILKSFYTDSLTGYRNRSFFDKFLQKKGKNKLDDGTVMVSVLINNQHELNDTFGREAGDEIIKMFADELRSAFANMKALYVYNGKSHFVIMIENTDSSVVEDSLNIFELAIEERDKFDNAEIQYKVGFAESFRDQLSSARKLLTASIRNYQDKTAYSHNINSID